MLSLRTVVRNAPQVLSRAAGAFPLRTAAAATSPTAALRHSTNTSLSSNVLWSARVAFMSSLVARRSSIRECDEELSAKIESEIQVEEDMKANEQQPASVKDFLENTEYKLQDTPGQETVKLTRSICDEKITVSFSIADLTNYDPYSQDKALADEDDSDPELQNNNRQIGSPSAGGGRPAPAEEDLEEDLDENLSEETNPPINVSIVIEKPGKAKSAISVEASAENGKIIVGNVFFYDDAKIPRLETHEAVQKRSDAYPGPPFGSLDEDLQVLMERYLEERGITKSMAIFITDYVEVKEQKEYLRWLNNLKNFVDA